MLAAEKLSHQDHVSLPPLLSWLTGILARCRRGALFLLLLILVVLLVGHAIRFAGKVAHPMSEFLTLDTIGSPYYTDTYVGQCDVLPAECVRLQSSRWLRPYPSKTARESDLQRRCTTDLTLSKSIQIKLMCLRQHRYAFAGRAVGF